MKALSNARVIAWDTETSLIRPALMAPALVVVTYQAPGQEAKIVHHTQAEPILRDWLTGDAVLVGHNVAYDLAVVCERFPHLRPLVFKAYANDRVTDTLIRQQLLDIAGGVYRGRAGQDGVWREYTYDLQAVAKRKAGLTLQKDGWRLSYDKFIDTPLAHWPARARAVQAEARLEIGVLQKRIREAIEGGNEELAKELVERNQALTEMVQSDPSRATDYPLDDARATLAVYQAQEVHNKFLHDQFRQARAAWALHLSSAWGLRTHEAGVERLRAATEAAYDALEDEMIQLGYIRDNKEKSRNTKLAKARMVDVCRESGLPVRRTKGHSEKDPKASKCRGSDGGKLEPGDDDCVEHVCLDAEACEASEDQVLQDYATVSTLKKVLSTDVVALSGGIEYPIHTRYGLAGTGRVTSSNPNIQNFRRLPGIRECFVPRPGMVFFGADYPALEAYTWAQCCVTWLGVSKLAEALNGGIDPHLYMAANILDSSYDDILARYSAGDQEVSDIRQLSKVANFGLPGGMGAKTFLGSAKKQLHPDVVQRLGLDLARAERLKHEWEDTWPEARLWFARVKRLGPPWPQPFEASVETLFTKRHRGGAGFCAACNTPFQALGVDCAKEAMWRVAVEQYEVPASALYNTRTVVMAHDELIGEGPEASAHEAAMRLADVMVEGANMYLKDVPIPRAKVKPVLMRVWSKDAKPIYGPDGRLIPWDMSRAA